ncbi:hypothetical protein BASA62_003509 [Batrachochytrium salamandrivorans]|nr:hypothetical protein BASA62_003509 [Batrachochytrium salamandrivorans]
MRRRASTRRKFRSTCSGVQLQRDIFFLQPYSIRTHRWPDSFTTHHDYVKRQGGGQEVRRGRGGKGRRGWERGDERGGAKAKRGGARGAKPCRRAIESRPSQARAGTVGGRAAAGKGIEESKSDGGGKTAAGLGRGARGANYRAKKGASADDPHRRDCVEQRIRAAPGGGAPPGWCEGGEILIRFNGCAALVRAGRNVRRKGERYRRGGANDSGSSPSEYSLMKSGGTWSHVTQPDGAGGEARSCGEEKPRAKQSPGECDHTEHVEHYTARPWFGYENYETLITKCAVHCSRLLKRVDQCRGVVLVSHLFWATDENSGPDAPLGVGADPPLSGGGVSGGPLSASGPSMSIFRERSRKVSPQTIVHFRNVMAYIRHKRDAEQSVLDSAAVVPGMSLGFAAGEAGGGRWGSIEISRT